MPKRIQRKRTKGWRMPDGAISVTRPGPYGNPFKPTMFTERHGGELCVVFDQDYPVIGVITCAAEAVDLFSCYAVGLSINNPNILVPLAGKDLACWCRLCEQHKDGLPVGETCSKCEPCHADIWLRLANPELEAVR